MTRHTVSAAVSLAAARSSTRGGGPTTTGVVAWPPLMRRVLLADVCITGGVRSSIPVDESATDGLAAQPPRIRVFLERGS